MRSSSLRLVSLVVPLWAGCSANVDGEIDGEKVPALFSTFFIQDKLEQGEVTTFTVAGSGVSLFNACDGAAKKQESFNQLCSDNIKDLEDAGTDIDLFKKASEDFVDGLVAYELANTPTDFWTVGVSLSGDNNEFGGNGADIDFTNPPENTDFVGGVNVCRVNDHPESFKDDDGFFRFRQHQTCFTGVKGTVDVNEYTEDKTLQIIADVDFSFADPGSGVDPDDDKGSATITISAGWCEGLELAIEDKKKLLEDTTVENACQ